MNVSPDELPVYASGRSGPRRVSVTECASTVTAEAVYDCLLAAGVPFGPDVHGKISYTVERVCQSVIFEVRRNAVWRQGRIFLGCDYCSRRCTRLYMPCVDSPLNRTGFIGGLIPREDGPHGTPQ
jgi:hypothetical protein